MTLRQQQKSEIDAAIANGVRPTVPRQGIGMVLASGPRSRKILVNNKGTLTPAGRYYYEQALLLRAGERGAPARLLIFPAPHEARAQPLHPPLGRELARHLQVRPADQGVQEHATRWPILRQANLGIYRFVSVLGGTDPKEWLDLRAHRRLAAFFGNRGRDRGGQRLPPS